MRRRVAARRTLSGAARPQMVSVAHILTLPPQPVRRPNANEFVAPVVVKRVVIVIAAVERVAEASASAEVGVSVVAVICVMSHGAVSALRDARASDMGRDMGRAERRARAG